MGFQINMFVRKIWDWAIEFLAFIKKNRKVKPKEKIVKVNLACGYTVYKGWINVDGGLMPLFSGFPRFILGILYDLGNVFSKISQPKKKWVDQFKKYRFIHHNLKYGIPLVSNSADYVYFSHFLEHLNKVEVVPFLKEVKRVLKKGGVVRISVPDLEYVHKLYAKGEKEKSLSYLFLEDPKKFSKFDRHCYMFDFELLKKFLLEAGFKNINKMKFQQGKTPDIKHLDNRPDESLFVEAEK